MSKLKFILLLCFVGASIGAALSFGERLLRRNSVITAKTISPVDTVEASDTPKGN